MKLILGGANQEKGKFCMEHFHIAAEELAEGGSISCEEIPQQGTLNHLHLWVKRLLLAGKDPESLVKKYCEENKEAIILCDEIGSGIVPVDAFDRAWREAVGRICCSLAGQADEVYRIYCGLPSLLKG